MGFGKNQVCKMSTKDLINWGELSRMLAGSRMTIRKNKIPKKHQKFIGELMELIDNKLKELK